MSSKTLLDGISPVLKREELDEALYVATVKTATDCVVMLKVFLTRNPPDIENAARCLCVIRICQQGVWPRVTPKTQEHQERYDQAILRARELMLLEVDPAVRLLTYGKQLQESLKHVVIDRS